MADAPLARRHPWLLLLAWAAVLCAVAVGVSLRLKDPLSTPVIPAEDPYTHMALVREHMQDGTLDPLYEPGGMYPPGLHAVLAAAWAYTGADLYQIVRLGPVLFGAVGVLGIALLAARFHHPRLDGIAAGAVAALAFALAPEVVFRTTMMSPTALDLAVLPFFLLALLALLLGRLGWAAPVFAMSAFLVMSHPWVFAVLGAAGVAFLVLALLIPWPQEAAPPISMRGAAI